MAFNADEYMGVIVEQIADNFTELHTAVRIVPEPEEIETKQIKATETNPDSLKTRELETKVSLYKQSISNMVVNYDAYRSIEPLSVGLFGEWGSGKTHLLKLIENQIIDTQKLENNPFKQTVIPVFFNAWRFEKEEHLIIPLFQTLLATIETYDAKYLSPMAKKQLGQTKERLKIVSFALAKGFKVPKNIKSTIANLMTGDFTVMKDFVDIDKIVAAVQESESAIITNKKSLVTLLKSDRIESIYMNIPQWIEKITLSGNINFVFLIDDLDRCLPENTLKMLESIKLFLDVPACAFILAIDDDVVERGVAYHYRDYLKDIVHIDGKIEKQSQELPITGHEYLEKMIQLPFRIPVITNTDVLAFLTENYKTKFEELFKEEKEEENRALEVIAFFAETIPPKPRKIKRTAMLFQTKVKIFKALEQHDFDHMLVAKLTLLELFAPKLLRFIQNNNYTEMFNVLYDFSNLVDSKNKEAKNSLENSSRIKVEIKKSKNEGDRRTYTKLLEIVEENYHSRMVFKLDHIFKTRIDKVVLKEAMEQKTVVLLAKEERVTIDLMSKEFETLLFGKSETQWRKAFDDHELFEEGKALLTQEDIDAITKKTKKKKGFYNNAKWFLLIAEYMTQKQFIKFLGEVYAYKMNPYQTTFKEYDAYCEDSGIGIPKDEGWGRGQRPVINVSWDDATAYAKWLSEKKGVEYRLPTEDEWYLACNVGAKTKWHFGDNEEALKKYAWYNDNSENKTHPVGKKFPNKLDIYDVHGNVWEWCRDGYSDEEKYKILRGGSWFINSNSAESSFRYWYVPTISNNKFGFRLQKTLSS